MIMKTILSVFLFLISMPVMSQDVTGIWRGYFNQVEYIRGEKLQGERYKIEVQLDQRNNRFDGVTYSYQSTVFYGKASARGTVNTKTRKVLMEELKIVEVRMSGPSDACIMTFFLQYSKSGDEEFLEGNYTSINTRDSSNCGRGTVFLRRVVTSDFYKEPFLVEREKAKEKEKADATRNVTAKANTAPKTNVPKPAAQKPAVAANTTPKKTTPAPKPNTTTTRPPVKPGPEVVTKELPKTDIRIAKVDSPRQTERKSPAVTVVPRVLSTRENEVVKTIVTNANEISINVYDNGTIDNDTVSVYLDKKLVISKQRLTGKPITLKFQLDDTIDYHELVMVAENLGEIPPNTSLMVVNAGNKQYEVRITSNEQKNAVVIFKYDKNN
jgi:hypothetical protein